MVIIYHANCCDGFCCAYLLKNLFPDAELLPYNYGTPAPYLKDQDIIIADFSFSREECLELKKNNKSLLILDHHKSAAKELEGLDFVVFNNEKSGARLVQEHFNIGPNWLIDYTEDRDLWRHKLEDTEEINMGIRCFPFDLDVWASFTKAQLKQVGSAALKYHSILVDQILANKYRAIMADNYVIEVCNCTYSFASHVAGKLAEYNTFGVCWFVRGDKLYQHSLRSIGDFDVGAYAKEFYGGGGHKNAGGFESEVEECLSF